MQTCDKKGHKWACLSKIKADDTIKLDDGFTCREAGFVRVFSDEAGKLYFECDNGRHYLEGQADDGEHLVGIYH